jgi:hypothetical protein
MKTCLRVLAPALLILGIAASVRADIPGPGPRPKPPIPAPIADKSVPMTIEVVDGLGPCKLVIPKKFAGNMKASLDTDDGTAVAEHKTSRVPAILAGVFLTLSLTFTGLWLVRQRGVIGARTIAMVLGGVVFVAIGGAALVWANAAPPPIARPVPAPLVNGDRVIIEIVDQGDAVKWIVPRAQLLRAAGIIRGGGGPVPLPPGAVPLPAPVPQPRPGGVAPGGAEAAPAEKPE